MRKRLFAVAAAAGLGISGLSLVVGTPVAEACGGNYDVTVEADTGQGVTYCSDGTVEGVRDLTAPGDSGANCGGEYAVAVGADTGQGVTYCSDGTLGDAGVPSTGPTGANCGGEQPVAVGADTGQGVTYCSDGTVAGVHDVTAPAGEEPSDCGDAGYPATVEVEPVDTGQGHKIGYCSDGTLDDLQDPPL